MPLVRTGDFDCFYDDDDFTDPWRESETLLIQHGFGRNSHYWNRWVPYLAGHYRVIRRDMRAHGGSGDTGPDYEWSSNKVVVGVVVEPGHIEEPLAAVCSGALASIDVGPSFLVEPRLFSL